MARGFVYLTAVVDWASRKVLAHRVVITPEAVHAVDALEDAFTLYGLPHIVNTDQGRQFTAGVFTEAVLRRDIRLSMDGRGCWRDNVFVGRVWHSIKYEECYLKAYGFCQPCPTLHRRIHRTVQPETAPFQSGRPDAG
ncbi:MAG: Mobile element protein [uncultured Paraburkholderia sp.]|nr:MAG: Mobile element protein [uncultured Paraburkholderia sp.]